MLPREDNELITRVGPGTPMGNTMRRYWMPALLSSEIPEPDCAPVRVRLLGEDLVAFRDTEGRIGLLDEFCPHRRVSLYFGRNEECGLRCVYHGWKFDVDGSCLDQLNEPEELQFKHKVHITAYPTVELGGVVWAYMGPPDKMPAPGGDTKDTVTGPLKLGSMFPSASSAARAMPNGIPAPTMLFGSLVTTNCIAVPGVTSMGTAVPAAPLAVMSSKYSPA